MIVIYIILLVVKFFVIRILNFICYGKLILNFIFFLIYVIVIGVGFLDFKVSVFDVFEIKLNVIFKLNNIRVF